MRAFACLFFPTTFPCSGGWRWGKKIHAKCISWSLSSWKLGDFCFDGKLRAEGGWQRIEKLQLKGSLKIVHLECTETEWWSQENGSSHHKQLYHSSHYFTTGLIWKWWRTVSSWILLCCDITDRMLLWSSALWYIFGHSDLTEHLPQAHSTANHLHLLPLCDFFFSHGQLKNNWVGMFMSFGCFWRLESSISISF